VGAALRRPRLDLDQMLDTIVAKTREVMGTDSAMVVSWDGRASKAYVLRAAGRLSGEYAMEASRGLAGSRLRAACDRGGGRPAIVVEDEPAVLDLVVTLLTDSGWHVDVAAGGRTGFERPSSPGAPCSSPATPRLPPRGVSSRTPRSPCSRIRSWRMRFSTPSAQSRR
jgi:hypothetical protein